MRSCGSYLLLVDGAAVTVNPNKVAMNSAGFPVLEMRLVTTAAHIKLYVARVYMKVCPP